MTQPNSNPTPTSAADEKNKNAPDAAKPTEADRPVATNQSRADLWDAGGSRSPGSLPDQMATAVPRGAADVPNASNGNVAAVAPTAQAVPPVPTPAVAPAPVVPARPSPDAAVEGGAKK